MITAKIDKKELNDLEKALKNMLLPDEDVRAIIISNGQRIINDAKARAAFSKTLANSIQYLGKGGGKYKNNVLIGPKYPKGALAHIYEYGTAPRRTKDGYNRGQIVARPFMRPALDTNKAAVMEGIKKGLFKLAEKIAKKNNLI